MYYLSSVDSCLNHFIPPEIRDPDSYCNLSNEQKTAVVVMAALLSPDLLLGKVIFAVPDNHPALGGSSNEFYEITEATHVLAADVVCGGVLMIEGKKVEVSSIMVFSETWLMTYYINSMTGELWRLKALSDDDDSGSKPSGKQVERKPSSYLSKTIARPEWVPDAKYTHCMKCPTKFGLFHRRHHCRCCGKLLCRKCTRNKKTLPSIRYYSRVRVCNDCSLK